MLTALAPPALPGPPEPLVAAPARRQDSSGSSSSYYTAPDSPETPDAGPDAEGLANWPRVAPALGAGAQPRLSVSAQNSRQQLRPGSGFQRGLGSDPWPPPPQLRTLPSGEMEVIFSTGPLFSRPDAADSEVQQLTEQAFRGLSPPGPASPDPATQQPQDPEGGSRWATYLELRPRGRSPAAPAQFECVEVALEESAAPARSRTVPKRQIELRPRHRSPPRETSAPKPPLLLRTGSLDESLGRLQAAASLVQTALARKLSPVAPARSSATFGSTRRPESSPRDTTGSARVVQEQTRSRPPRIDGSSVPARAPRPWPSLRERAIRRDKPAPGTEPLGPVSSSIFLQSGEKTHEAPDQEPKTRFPPETPEPAAPRAQSPAFESGASWDLLTKAATPGSQSPPWQAPNGIVRGPRCVSPENLPLWTRASPRARSPPLPQASFEWKNQDPTVEETVSRRSPSPPTLSQWNQGIARAGSPSPEVPSQWAVRHPPVGNKEESRSRSPQALPSWEVPDRPVGTWNPSPREMWDSSIVSHREALNGVALERLAPETPEPAEARSPSTREMPDLAFGSSQRLPEVAAPELPPNSLLGTVDTDARPEALGPGEAASGRRRVAIPRPRDVRKMVKTTYAPSFLAGASGSGQPLPPADPNEEKGGASRKQELGSPAPAYYTSVFLKDFLPVVSHPYEPPEPPPDTVPRDALQPNGVLRRRAENSTAKPFARTEIRLPGALALVHRPEGTRGALAHDPAGENLDAEVQCLLPEGEGRASPQGGARSSPQRSPVGSAGARRPGPGSPLVHPRSSPGRAPKLETPPTAPKPEAAAQSSPSRESTGKTAPPLPRAASAPPMDRAPGSPSLGPRRQPRAAPSGKVLVDPESGRYYFVEAPRQPRLRLLFDPESGQYVEVLLPPSPLGPSRRVYTPVALGPGLYPPAYGPVPGLSLPPSPGPQAFSGHQLPWASEAASLDGMYYLPVSGNPSPAPPLLLCAPPPCSGPTQPGKGSLFPA
ncbi:proline-rich basic protein 1 [Talpa occidentalis]|uniref:proline-rich basic protein 1 n=1 Tax=Talpa occidentalis TaxID=50954 RepID=UPI00188EE7F7|nr:proline-rich basic protein 1 [Talpa occidentalis]